MSRPARVAATRSAGSAHADHVERVVRTRAHPVTTFMGNGAQHAIATAAAAFLCKKYGATPRTVHDTHLTELRQLISGISARSSELGQPLPERS